MTTFRRRGRVTALLLTVAVLLTACGGSDEAPDRADTGDDSADVDIAPGPTESDAAAGATEAEFPVAVSAANGEVEIDQRPERIVSLSPTATEMLFAIDAGGQVVAVDSYSNYPEEAPITDLAAFQPNIEAITEYDPDLVVASNDPGDLVDGLTAVGVPTILLTSAGTLDDTYQQIEQLGVATGHVDEATELVSRMQREIDEISASVPEFDEAPTYYHELDPTYYTVTSDTFVGQVYALLGLENIADAAEGAGEAGGYPQLSAEYIVEADPDFIFLADTKCCEITPESVAERPGWAEITAVQRDAIVPLDDDVASRWGPRIVEFLRTVAERVGEVEAAA